MSAANPPRLVSVKLTAVGRAHTYLSANLPGDSTPGPGDSVVVQSDGGSAIGTVVRSIPQLVERRVAAGETTPPRVVRVATHDDIVMRLKHEHREREAYRIATLKIREHGLGMKVTRVEQAFDGSRLVFYFTADGRVDDPHRDAADRRARRGQDDRRLRHVRTAAVLHDVSDVVRACFHQDGEAAGSEPEPVKTVRALRPAQMLSPLRAPERERRGARRMRQRRRLR